MGLHIGFQKGKVPPSGGHGKGGKGRELPRALGGGEKKKGEASILATRGSFPSG